MSLVGTIVGYVLTLFVVLMIARMILDWTRMLSNGPPWVWRARTAVTAVTEPVVAPVRRVLRPIRAGGVSFDLAFTAVFFVALILRSVAFSL